MSRWSGVVLAGGKSRRMGRDKATLLFRGRPLWEHQMRTLREAGATDVFLSAQRAFPDAAARNIPVVTDLAADKGPLAGISAALAHAAHEYVLVLAVDLPLVPAAFLHELGSIALRAKRGVIPQRLNLFEPLAAVYARNARAYFEKQLAHGAEDRSLQRLARTLVDDDLSIAYRLAGFEESFFTNLNTPDDLARLEQS
ncbi:MAG TPA: molybdenum cofactor guanylyltransferase [Chthoniobacteraceae bacterium]|nr:molybdenum cofactor guanylyltransferase [Chthoniobacteraceae bacterium]